MSERVFSAGGVPIHSTHYTMPDGTPDGGRTYGIGMEITWQRGPLGRGEDRAEPNGAFVEGVIGAALDRLNYYQDSKFGCVENEWAIRHLEAAIHELQSRTARREAEGVEGTATP